MNIKHFVTTVFFFLTVTTPLCAQEQAVFKVGKNASGILLKMERQTARGLMVRPPYKPEPVPLIELKRSLSGKVSLQSISVPPVVTPSQVAHLVSSAQVAKPKQYQPPDITAIIDPGPADVLPGNYVSPYKRFLQEDWEWESPRFQERSCEISGGLQTCQQDITATRWAALDLGMPPGTSMEEMEMRARAVGIPTQTIQTSSVPELWLLVHYYETMSNGAKIPSLFDAFAEKEHIEKGEAARDKWAQDQPNFVEENYGVTDYQQPFRSSVKDLRILLINDEQKIIDSFVKLSASDSRISVMSVNDVASALRLLRRSPSYYDVILTDYVTRAGSAPELGMWSHEHGALVPIVFFSKAGGTASWLYSYNMAGSISPSEPVQNVVNYLSNLVATGRAYPNGK